MVSVVSVEALWLTAGLPLAGAFFVVFGMANTIKMVSNTGYLKPVNVAGC